MPLPDDPSRPLLDVSPSAFAAGIIAARERRLGLPWGPANALAVGAVAATANVSDALHNQLHLAGINVYRVDRGGVPADGRPHHVQRPRLPAAERPAP